MVAITEERKNSLKKASRSYKERERERGKERRIVEGKLQRHRGSHRGGKRDKLSRFFLSLRPPRGREYKQVSPGRISPRSTAAPIENLRQFSRVLEGRDEGGRVNARIVRKNWRRGRKRGKRKKEGKEKKRERGENREEEKSSEATPRSLPLNSA